MPAVGNMTIASLRNIVWQYRFLKCNTIGLVPQGGYVNNTQQSYIALTWLWFLDICHYNGAMKHFGKQGCQ